MVDWPIEVDEGLRERVLSRVRAHRAHVTLIDGAAGVGKSTLASSVAASLAADGYRILPIAGMPELRDIPLGALAPLLAGPDTPEDEPAAERLHRFFSVVARPGAERLLVVDDGPELDDVSASVVYQLVQTYGLRCVMTARSPVTLVGPLRRLDDEGAIERVHLTGLDEDAMTRLVETALGDRVEPESLAALLRLAGGNPLFLRGIVLAAQRVGTSRTPRGLVVDTSLLPAHLRDTIAARFERLGDAERELAELIATAGRWPDGLLGQSAALRGLEAQGLTHRSEEDVTLAHPLFGEHLLAELDDAERQRRRVEASRLLRTAGLDAHRFTAACLLAETPDRPDAGELEWAARYAHDVDDHILAIRLATLSIDSSDATGSAIHLLRADSSSQIGELDDAEEEFAVAARLAEDDDAVAAVATRLGFHLALRRQDPAAAIAEGHARLEQLPIGRARSFLRANLAKWQLMVGAAPDADDLESHGPSDAASEVNATVFRLSAAVFAGDLAVIRAATATLRERAAAARPVVKHGAQFADFAEFWVMLLDGRITAAVEYARRERTEAGASTIGMWDFALALATSLAGPVDEAVGFAESASRELAVVDFIGARTAAVALHATALARSGRAPEARRLLASLPTDSASYIAAQVQAAQAEAWMLANAGQHDTAIDTLLRSAEVAIDAKYTTFAGFAGLAAIGFGGASRALPLLRRVSQSAPGATLQAITDYAAAVDSGSAEAVLESATGLATIGLPAVGADAARIAAELAGTTGDARLTRRASVLAGSLDPAPRATGDPFALTPREWDVALAAARRARNREIADALGLSHRTVENHLANVFRKLGIAGRDELRAELEALGALDGSAPPA